MIFLNKKFSFNNIFFEKDTDMANYVKNIDRGVIAITKDNIYSSVLSDPRLYHVHVINAIVEMLSGHKFESLDIYENAKMFDFKTNEKNELIYNNLFEILLIFSYMKIYDYLMRLNNMNLNYSLRGNSTDSNLCY